MRLQIIRSTWVNFTSSSEGWGVVINGQPWDFRARAEVFSGVHLWPKVDFFPKRNHSRI
jgi:hypothetical protein